MDVYYVYIYIHTCSEHTCLSSWLYSPRANEAPEGGGPGRLRSSVLLLIIIIRFRPSIIIVCFCLTRRSLSGPDGIGLRGALEAGGP